MAFKEKEQEFQAQANARVLTSLPTIRLEAHAPLDTFSVLSDHSRFRSEGTFKDPQDAELRLRVASNAEQYLNPGSSKMASRFLETLQQVKG